MSQLRKMERRKQKKLHLLGGEERLKIKAGDNEPFGISKAGYNAIYQAGYEAGMQAERDKMIPYYANTSPIRYWQSAARYSWRTIAKSMYAIRDWRNSLSFTPAALRCWAKIKPQSSILSTSNNMDYI